MNILYKNVNGKRVELNQEEIDQYLTEQPTKKQLLQDAKDKKLAELKEWRDAGFGELLLVRSNPDYYVKPSPKENIFLAYNSMLDNDTKTWRVMDSEGNKLFSTDIDGKNTGPLLLELTKDELKNASNHYENRKTELYEQHDLKGFEISALKSIKAVNDFDVTKIIA